MEQITVSGKLQWDDTKRLVFLEEMIERDIKPKLPKEETTASAAAPTATDDVEADGADAMSIEGGDNDF